MLEIIAYNIRRTIVINNIIYFYYFKFSTALVLLESLLTTEVTIHSRIEKLEGEYYMAQQPEDDFEYWMKLDGRKGKILEIVNHTEEQLQKFAKIVTERGFKCANYSIFPFDTRVISVTAGNYDNYSRSFTISLEDILILENDILNVPITRAYSWKGDCESPDRKDFMMIVLETEEVRKIKVSDDDLLVKLKWIYRNVAKRFDLPSL